MRIVYDTIPMLKHQDVWRAIDRLATEHKFSAPGRAGRGGLDRTPSKKTKRQTREGRLRWPSTESVAKILTATGASLGEFVSYINEGEGGGVTVNQASHAIDLLQWLVGSFSTLYAQWDNAAHPTVEVDTMVAATATLSKGGLATISFGLNPRQTDKGFFEIVVYGDNGAWASLREEPEGAYGLNTQWEIPGEEAQVAALTEKERMQDHRMYRIVDQGRRPPELNPECYRAQYMEFLAYLDGEPGYALTGDEGLKSVESIEAIYRSAREKRPVAWPIERGELGRSGE